MSEITPDFSRAIDLQERIIATENFLYGGDPRAVGLEGLMRERERRHQQAATTEVSDVPSDTRVIETIDLRDVKKFIDNLLADR